MEMGFESHVTHLCAPHVHPRIWCTEAQRAKARVTGHVAEWLNEKARSLGCQSKGDEGLEDALFSTTNTKVNPLEPWWGWSGSEMVEVRGLDSVRFQDGVGSAKRIFPFLPWPASLYRLLGAGKSVGWSFSNTLPGRVLALCCGIRESFLKTLARKGGKSGESKVKYNFLFNIDGHLI